MIFLKPKKPVPEAEIAFLKPIEPVSEAEIFSLKSIEPVAGGLEWKLEWGGGRGACRGLSNHAQDERRNLRADREFIAKINF